MACSKCNGRGYFEYSCGGDGFGRSFKGLPRREVCSYCGGTGAEPRSFAPAQTSEACSKCNGSGYLDYSCGGDGFGRSFKGLPYRGVCCYCGGTGKKRL